MLNKKKIFYLSALLSAILLMLIIYLLFIGIVPEIKGSSSSESIDGYYSMKYSIIDVDYENDCTDVTLELIKPYDGVSLISSSSKIINGETIYKIRKAYGIELDSVIMFQSADTIRCNLIFESAGIINNHKEDILHLPMPTVKYENHYINIGIGGFYLAKINFVIIMIMAVLSMSVVLCLYKMLKRDRDREELKFIIDDIKSRLTDNGVFSTIYKLILDDEIDNIDDTNSIIINASAELYNFINTKYRNIRLSEKDYLLFSLIMLDVPNKIILRLMHISEKTLYNKKSMFKSVFRGGVINI